MSDEPDQILPINYISILESLPATDAEAIKKMGEELVESRHYAAMGRVADNWAYFESVVDTWSIKLVDMPIRWGICFTAQIAGITRKLDAFISLARLRKLPVGMVDKLCKFAETAKGLSERRNRLIHDVWFFNHPEPPQHLEATARKKLRIKFIPTPTTELLKFAVDINANREKFETMAEAIIALPRTSPKTSAQDTDQKDRDDHPLDSDPPKPHIPQKPSPE